MVTGACELASGYGAYSEKDHHSMCCSEKQLNCRSGPTDGLLANQKHACSVYCAT